MNDICSAIKKLENIKSASNQCNWDILQINSKAKYIDKKLSKLEKKKTKIMKMAEQMFT